MSLGQVLGITSVFLLSLIGFAILFKGFEGNVKVASQESQLIEVSLEPELELEPVIESDNSIHAQNEEVASVEIKNPVSKYPLDKSLEADRMIELFSTSGKKLPFIDTISYKSRVPWQKGRPAWLSDYAAHYGTSRHFIARSLNGKPDYLKQEIAEGNKFNVFRQGYPIEFQLVIDISRCKMWFYALSGASKEKILLKTYTVSLGRPDPSKRSGSLTPLGKYQLGNKTAIYKPEIMGHYKGQKTEMMQVFGTRWIPFEREVSETTEPAKGLGLHGLPWLRNKKGELEQNISSLGKFESDGCIRLETHDIEELFAIIITKPTYVELVKDISQSELFK